jgi:LemA protein
MSIVVWVFLGVVAVVVVAAIAMFNRLVGLRNRYRNAFAQIDVQLKRRHDLIPNLVETAKAYMAHERQTLESVVAARQTAVGAAARAAAQPGQPEAMRGLAAAEAGLTGALGRLFAVAEAYPELKASENFLRLQEDLTDTEDKIAAARRYYNATVMRFNTAIQSLPWVLVAGALGFREREFFDAGEDARAVPQVDLSRTP